ncbi:DUF6999 family protein [Brytella acorum]|uniref:Uncharacterized protein n=1 Tax=Brytella acorum TaxID=2959299 RepID=A0AA35UYN4_9PROT|nr:hypothetical protein [Brytella acorum]CAI9121886.1 hypothetical protein LMG32879_002742 [Brytella acorum]
MSEYSGHDTRDPDPWLALVVDESLPLSPYVKKLLAVNGRSKSRQFLLPFVRPVARMGIILTQIVRTVIPGKLANSPLLHNMIANGMTRFVRPEANLLILRHFHLGAEILTFIADNATPGFRPDLHAMRPESIDAVRDDLFLKHDLNIYNFIIALNEEMQRRGTALQCKEKPDFSAISDCPPDIALPPQGRINVIDLETAIECYTPLYSLLLTDNDFWRASNSLQLDETIGLYVARIMGNEAIMALANNRHPLLPLPTWTAGYRLLLHGLATETLHAFLRNAKMRDPDPA